MRRRAGVTAMLLMSVVASFALLACGGDTGATKRPPGAITSPTVKPSVVYVALGASDAVGVGASDPNTTAYVPRLIAELPRPYSALNLGVSGYTIQQALANELPQALAAHPTLVTVWLIGNDFRECTPLASYGRDLDSLLGQLQTKTKAQVFVANVPDMSLLPAIRSGSSNLGACLRGRDSAQIRALVGQWNMIIAASVAKHHAVLVDLYHSDLASHPEYISRDGFHPSDAGYRVLADLFWRQITARHAIPGM